jgi:NTP pyrophosphatase (non-canonical NTP hydrolase)
MEIAEIQATHVNSGPPRVGLPTDPTLRLAYLVTEVGEVAREVIELNQGAQQSVEARERLGMEIYDVIWNLCDLANILSVDWKRLSSRRQPSIGSGTGLKIDD